MANSSSNNEKIIQLFEEQSQQTISYTVVREEAKFIPVKMMKVQHIEHAYECKGMGTLWADYK